MLTPYELDSNLFLLLNGDGGWVVDQIMWYASGKFTWIPLYVVLLWWVWRTKGVKTTVIFLVAALLIVLFADQTASLFKANLPKLRPTHYPPFEGLVHTVNGYLGGQYGTVSSHAANTLGIAILSSLAIRRRWVTVALSGWVILVCYSRIYLGVHYPCDIIFGLIDGAIWGTVFGLIFRKIEQ